MKMKRPNFSLLAEKYPDLIECSHKANAISGTSEPYTALNWNLARSQRTLTAITLKENFGIEIDLPFNRLCPPVPNRLSYIRWLSDLLALIPLSTECVIASPSPTNCDPRKAFLGDERSKLFLSESGLNLRSSKENESAPARISLDSVKRLDRTCLTDHVLDIGVGASCIYPLLGHQQHNWRFDAKLLPTYDNLLLMYKLQTFVFLLV